MAWNEKELFSGGATLFQVDSTDVGGTTGGVRIRREADWLDFEIDQSTLIVKKQITLSRMFIETNFAQSVIDTLRIVWQIPTSFMNASSTSLSLAEPSGASADEVALTIEGPPPDEILPAVAGGKRTFNMPRCVALADGEYNMDRGTMSGIPVTFEAMAASGVSSFGTVWDET
jgi:hypothetical protein